MRLLVKISAYLCPLIVRRKYLNLVVIYFFFLKEFLYFYFLFIYLFSFGCVGSSFLCEGFL